MKILVAVDGSKHSEEALRAVGRISPDADVVLVHASDATRFLYPVVGMDVIANYAPGLEQEMRRESERMLDHCASLVGIDRTRITQRLGVGSPGDVIVAIAEEEKADLVVMGARGLGPIQELIFGSVSHRVLAHAPCPVLVLRRPLSRIRRILLPVETEADTDLLLDFIARRPFPGPLEFFVITAVPLPLPEAAMMFPEHEEWMHAAAEHARATSRGVADRLTAMGHAASGEATFGSPVEVILHEAESKQVDLVLMGSRGRRAMTRFFLGSVAHAVLHRAKCPVLIGRRGTKSNLAMDRNLQEEVAKR